MNSEPQIPRGDFKKLRAEIATQKRKLKRIFWVIGGVLLIGLFVFFGMSFYSWKKNTLPGRAIPDQGREHVTAGHAHQYNSNPPTSGPHFARPEEWGTYREERPDEVLVHNLEHGGIWISYKPGIPEEVIKKLEGFHQQYGRKIIVTPRMKNDADIALAAWGRLDTFSVSEYSEERVKKFIAAFRNKGPEFVP